MQGTPFRRAEEIGLEHGRRQRADAQPVLAQQRFGAAQDFVVRLRDVHAPQRAQLHRVDGKLARDLQSGLQVVGDFVGDNGEFHGVGL